MKMGNKDMHIVLVGCGNWGRYILRDLCSLDCRVTVIAKSERSTTRAKEYGAHEILNNLSEVSSADGFVVATPLETHFSVISEILDKFPNIPIYSEKALTDSYEQAKILVERAPNHLFVMDKWRYHEGVLKLAEIVRTKQLGEITGIKTSRLGWGSAHDNQVDPVCTLLPHDISIAYEILGFIPEPVSAVADMLNGDAFGLFATLGTNPWVSIEVSSRSLKRIRQIQLFCEKGVAILEDSFSENIEISYTKTPFDVGEKIIEKIPVGQSMPLHTELKAFVDYLKGEAPAPKSSVSESAENVKVIEELRKLAGVK